MESASEGGSDAVFGFGHVPSVVDDALFQAFVSTTQNRADQHIWTLMSTFQEYPSPELLLEHKGFAEHVVSTEPGRKIDYADLRNQLDTAQEDLVGDREEKQKLFTQCNELVRTHVRYVKATAAVYGYRLFDMLIDRFYGMVDDQRFQIYWQSTSPTTQSSWPTYKTTKQDNADRLNAWTSVQQHASWLIQQHKTSPATKAFQAKLKSAIERHEARQKRQNSIAPYGPQYASRRHFSSPPYLTPLQRKAAIRQRNSSADHSRAAKNMQHKRHNLRNHHQLGNQSRICLSDNVIAALARINASYQSDLFNENAEGDKDESDEGVSMMAAEVHVSQEEQEEKCKRDFGGIIIPDGFVNLCPEVVSGQHG